MVSRKCVEVISAQLNNDKVIVWIWENVVIHFFRKLALFEIISLFRKWLNKNNVITKQTTVTLVVITLKCERNKKNIES